jgi:hypothetical protein
LIYERCVAAYASEVYGSLDITVQPNVYLMGTMSRTRRQVDVLVDYRWGGGTHSRMIIDAKKRSRPVDIADIETFEGMMRDCLAVRGVVVCTSGHTPAALRRAQDAITISLLSYDKALEYDWAYEDCLGPCAARNRKTTHRGGVLWGEWLVVGSGGAWVILQIGKCDGCHCFHVWCQDCGDKFAVPEGQVIHCSCENREWASVPESYRSGHVGMPSSIWLMMREPGGQPIAIDRRPIR